MRHVLPILIHQEVDLLRVLLVAIALATAILLVFRRNKMDKTHPEVEEVKQLEITNEELRKTLTAMHYGLMGMQARLDDHEKVIETMMLALENLTSGQVPDGFRQPKKGH